MQKAEGYPNAEQLKERERKATAGKMEEEA